MRQPTQKIEAAFFDLAGASAYTGGALSIRTLRRLIAEPNGLPHYRIGRGKLMISRTDLEKFLAARRHTPVDLDRLASEALAEMGGAK